MSDLEKELLDALRKLTAVAGRFHAINEHSAYLGARELIDRIGDSE